MYKKIECVEMKCDSCKRIYYNYNDFSVFFDMNEAEEYATEDEWYIEDEKHYCPNCYDVDLNGKKIVRQK